MKDSILSIVRHVLTFAGGIAVAKGYLDPTQLETVVGAMIAIGGVVWGVAEKRARPA